MLGFVSSSKRTDMVIMEQGRNVLIRVAWRYIPPEGADGLANVLLCDARKRSQHQRKGLASMIKTPARLLKRECPA
eukprot:6206056-Pleurochrysis_carterae.AAC.3